MRTAKLLRQFVLFLAVKPASREGMTDPTDPSIMYG